MSVYVDDVRLPFGRMVMCHMWADTEPELHAAAHAIGSKRRWFQGPPKSRWAHYDISLGKKAEAIARGAILTDRYGAAEHVARLEGNQRRLEQIAACRSRHVTPQES